MLIDAMRTAGGGGGGYRAVQQQQVLGAEAAAAVRQAAGLARRRGHAQVTPLHVACAVMSSSSSSSSSAPGTGTGAAGLLLPSACPLRKRQQHEAAAAALKLQLQLRLDAALGRLPVRAPFQHASAPKTTMVPLSNALVAALKRAQAAAVQHRRSGNAVVVVELERLVASILDDPNVNRAVREAASAAGKKKGAAALSSGESSSAACPETTALHRAHPVDQDGSLSCHHRDQSSETKQRTGQSAIVGGTKARASLPPWLRRINQDQYHPNLTRIASHQRPKFTELTAENLKIMCNDLEARVPPRHKDIVPGIAATVLRCRSGMMRRCLRPPAGTTWLLFRGNDWRSKKAMALELARLVFGSYTEFTSANSDPGLKIMRRRWPRDNGAYVGTRLLEAILKNPHRMVFIDGIDDGGLDHHESGDAIKNVIMACNGNGNGGLDDAIIVLSSDGASSSSSSPPAKRRRGIGHYRGEQITREGSRRRLSLDLNAPTEDEEDHVVREEEEDENLVDDDHAGIMGLVDGVFQFD
ncbi:protein SMAX1-LIKE 3-like [Brachypodium distachyon]|nr:protein SMAX1-LIKE 3-like [Brachypodium distachyon]|eukprot:XP_024310685.1 protein SMAX1-LIKE 3-like [Brachypodium distachyon]